MPPGFKLIWSFLGCKQYTIQIDYIWYSISTYCVLYIIHSTVYRANTVHVASGVVCPYTQVSVSDHITASPMSEKNSNAVPTKQKTSDSCGWIQARTSAPCPPAD